MSDERPFRSPSRPAADAVQRHHALLTDGAFTRALLANSGEAIKVLDLAGRIEFISDGALRALAIGDADALIGTSWAALLRNDAQATWGGWEQPASPTPDAAAQPARLLVIARDVSERRLAHESQQKMVQEL